MSIDYKILTRTVNQITYADPLNRAIAIARMLYDLETAGIHYTADELLTLKSIPAEEPVVSP
jgi:hypothetical protein